MLFSCHVSFVIHSYDDTLILLCNRACGMSCALPMPIICSHEMIAMISSRMLHLRTTSLHDLLPMIACLVASLMIHTCSFHAVDSHYCHAIFTTPHARYAWIVVHFRHFIYFGVVNASYAYHRPFVERLMHACYELEVDAYSLLHICASLPHIYMLVSMMPLILLNLCSYMTCHKPLSHHMLCLMTTLVW